ncbi:protein phosphatase 1 regulatory subunit 14A [Sarcophilus harrisii]|uniref:Protein phosphatase 1 regulatory subunit 14 n=1 Tax=Sarcophilus harrisii TaxID=9305 RepID=A0A7N4Q226_SARHA|nr:protein phosphatase 1 regulatory subunit 14A [Sarcophilus harrisii]
MAAQRLGKRVLSKLQSPSRAGGSPGNSPGGLQKRHARVTVKYDRRELQRRLDVEKWIDGRLEELYQGRVRPEPPGRGRGFGSGVWSPLGWGEMRGTPRPGRLSFTLPSQTLSDGLLKRAFTTLEWTYLWIFEGQKRKDL